jgi:outer membrane protein TolC
VRHDRFELRAIVVLLVLLPLTTHSGDWTELAPSKSNVPWTIPNDNAGTRSYIGVAEDGRVAIDPARTYGLAELIDIAQRNNPETREAWERARQAALAVGLVESTYAPQLSAEAIAGYQRTPLPIPSTLVDKGYFTAESRELIPSLTVKWLLFDFGRRSGAEQAARENSFVANVTFTGAHQKLIFAVSSDYYALNAARGRQRAAEQALTTTEIDSDAVEARRANGLATTVELARARRQTAQASFNVARANGAERKAYAALIATVAISPTTEIRVADSSGQNLPPDPGASVDRFLTDALSNRPDIVAGLGKIRAAQASLAAAQAEHNPTVTLAASLYQNMGSLNTDDQWDNVDKPGGSILLHFSWPLFDAGLRRRQVEIARAEVAAADDALNQTRNMAAKEVTDAYYALKIALAEYDAANTLTEAAQVAHDAGLQSYKQGVGTYTSLQNDANELIQAQTELEDSRASVLTAAAALAFAAGSITSDVALSNVEGEHVRQVEEVD